MRVVRSTLFGLLVLGASAGVARAQATQQVPQAHRRQAGMNAGHPGRGARGLFRGIQLTDAEKASLKTVREKYKGQFKSLHDSFKPQRDELRAARQRGDTAAAKAIWAKSATQREQLRALMTREQGEMRAALTPEHQVAFDKNVAELKQRMAQRMDKATRKRDGSVRQPGA